MVATGTSTQKSAGGAAEIAGSEKRRGPIYAEYRGPGPLAYQLRPMTGTNNHCLTKTIAPAYSIGVKVRDPPNQVPGPEYIIPYNVTSKGRQECPAYSLQSRYPIKEPEITPGPGSYPTHYVKWGTRSCERQPPRITIGQKSCYPDKRCAPPPNSYNVAEGSIGIKSATRSSVPWWSLQSKPQFGSVYYDSLKSSHPGPGAYRSFDSVQTRRNAQKYSMQGRTSFPDYSSIKHNPGPGAYNPTTLKKHPAAGPSMGTRHSQYTVMCLTDIDVM